MKTWNDIFGQDRAIESLRRVWAEDRLPHGLIFAGPIGVGKGTTAEVLAGLFLCEFPQGDNPCAKCASCRVFAAGNHPDYHLIYRQLVRIEFEKRKAIDLSIDVIRPYLLEPAGRKAGMGRGKVFIIEQADLMNPQAQNSMLKTLEEPAGRTVIILLTDQPGALLPTIRSRCQIIRFAALSQDRVRSELQKLGHAPADAADAAALAEGSLGLALKWLQDGVVDAARELRGMIEGAMSGRPIPQLPEWFKKSADAYAEKQLARDELASKDQASREALLIYLQLAAQQFRQRLSSTREGDDLEPPCAAIDAVAQAERYLDGNVNIALIFQQFAVRLEQVFGRATV